MTEKLEKKAEVVEKSNTSSFQQSKNWNLTDYDLEKPNWEPNVRNLVYAVYQIEKCPKTGALHKQGYIHMKVKKDMFYMKKHFSKTAHWSAMYPKSSPDECRTYCMKKESRISDPIEIGEFKDVTSQGQRTDLVDMYNDLKEGSSTKNMIENWGGSFILHNTSLQKLVDKQACEHGKGVLREVETIYCWGGFWLWKKLLDLGEVS